MITPDYARTMARYNAWQNRSLYREAARLDDARRCADRGAFFGSIHNTLAHLLWGDIMWMRRFEDGWEAPDFGPAEGARALDWYTLVARRRDADARISDWAARLTPDALEGDLSWHSGIENRTLTKPRWMLVTHLFNHQTHHRGQVHAMLTACGMTPDATDLGFMDEKESPAA